MVKNHKPSLKFEWSIKIIFSVSFFLSGGQEIRFMLAKADKNSPKMTKKWAKCSNFCQKCRFEMFSVWKNDFVKVIIFWIKSGQIWKSHCTTVFKSCYNITTVSTFSTKIFQFYIIFVNRFVYFKCFFTKWATNWLTRIRNIFLVF